MPLEVHCCEESDLLDFTDIQIAAFAGGQAIIATLTPNPMPADYKEKSLAKHVKSIREEPDVTYVKVIDTDLDGRMIAGAKWRINKKERTEEQIQSMLPVPGPAEEGRPGAQDFLHFLHSVRKQYMGTKPFAFLQILMTHPDHHRRGAGSLLLDCGIDKANDFQLRAFLESSAMGRPLYTRKGFVPQEEKVWDLTKYGLEGTDISTIMIREPLFYVM